MSEYLPAGIIKRGQSYRVEIQEGGVRKTGTAYTRQGAIDLKNLLHAELCAGARTRYTLEEAYTHTVRDHWAHLRDGIKLARNGQVVLKFFGPETEVSHIEHADVAAFIGYLESQGNSNGTINRKLAALSKIMTVAQDYGWINNKPPIHRRAEGPGRIRVMTPEEETQLLSILQQWGKGDHADTIMMLLDTGMRPSELFNLELKDIWPNWTPPNKVERVGRLDLYRTKTDLNRSLPMTLRVRTIIERRIAQGILFPYSNNWLEGMWNRVRVMMGLHTDPQFIPYICRHTCASTLLQRGMTIPELQVWLGHKTITMTMRYAHLCPTALVKGAQMLER